MGTRSAGQRKRFRKRSEREKHSQIIKARYKPKHSTSLPEAMTSFQTILANEAIDITNVTIPTHRPALMSRGCVAFEVSDPKNGKALIGPRYLNYALAAGLTLYEFASRPLPVGDGINASLIVGPPKN